MRIQNIIDTYGLRNIPISSRSMIDLWGPYLQRLDTQIKHREVIENLLNPRRQPHWHALTGQPGVRRFPKRQNRRPTYTALYRRMLDHR
jgi:hypothetical protein